MTATAHLHESITLDRIMPLAEQQMFGTDDTGVCLACGEERDGCEPDAENYECYACGQFRVMGVSELMIMIA